MTWLLSVDPGLRWCGCALWDADARLHRAELVRSDEDSADLAVAATQMVRSVMHWLADENNAPPQSVPHVRLVCEQMRTYGGRARGRADANDLIAVATMVGGLVMEFTGAAKLVLPTKRPKSVTRERARELLSVEELARARLPRGSRAAENVWDAVGIGLDHLGRT